MGSNVVVLSEDRRLGAGRPLVQVTLVGESTPDSRFVLALARAGGFPANLCFTGQKPTIWLYRAV